MTPVIEQSVSFPNATRAELYRLFMDSTEHSAATGMPARVSGRVGGKWSAFGGMIRGKTLALVPHQVIVQSWRSSAWKRTDPDSILVVRLESTKTGAAAHLTHVGVPSYDHKGVTQGWKKYYWQPWKNYLKNRKRPAARR
jgi:activator of HSP90 ATPase